MKHRIIVGDCVEVMAGMELDSVDAIVTDPPYGLEFMGRDWDKIDGKSTGSGKRSKPGIGDRETEWVSNGGWNSYRCRNCGHLSHGGSPCRCEKPDFVRADDRWKRMQEWHESWAREALRVLKPGGHLLAFGGTRTYHRLACAIEDAGFEIRDTLAWMYGCLSDDTEILIDGRWEPYHKATTGSRALCYNPDDDSYAWLPIQETFRYDVVDTAYRIRSDSTDQLVSRNHRCLVERGGTYVFELAETLAQEPEIRVPVLEGLPELLRDLPVPDGRASHAQQGVLAGLRRRALAWATDAQAALRATGNALALLCDVRGGRLEAEGMGQEDGAGVLLLPLRGQGTGKESRQILRQRQGQETTGHGARRGGEPGVEGRRHLLQDTRQLHRRALRALSGRVPGDGPEGRLRDGASAGGRADHRASIAPLGSRASQGPQAGPQRSVQPTTVRQQQRPQTVRASRYTRSDLATVRATPYRGVVWCVRVPTGAFVAKRNGKVFVTGNSGFPKSLDVSKAIDKAAGAEREVVGRKGGRYETPINDIRGGRLVDGDAGGYDASAITAPATPDAARWDGWGTALKPSHEPIVVARKPLIGTVVANVLAHGTGALNIDGCRIETNGRPLIKSKSGPSLHTFGDGLNNSFHAGTTTLGRWPANVVLDQEAAAILDATVLPSKSRAGKPRASAAPGNGWGMTKTGAEYSDAGGPSRFFFTAKASRKEREVGMSGAEKRGVGSLNMRTDAHAHKTGNATKPASNHHPTVKPVALMRWLVRLVTPPRGLVLDPFGGSGTTAMACESESFDSVLIERDPEYVDIAQRRIVGWSPMFADVEVVR